MEDANEYQRRVATAVMKAIFDASLTNIDGQQTAYIRSTEVCEALVTAMATIMEGVPPCGTTRGMRDMSEKVGRGLFTMIHELRSIREETGRSAFGATAIYPS